MHGLLGIFKKNNAFKSDITNFMEITQLVNPEFTITISDL